MLSHRSGMPRHDLAAWRLELPRAEFVKRLRHRRFSAGFRERFQYDNLMYYALAHVVEPVAGERWEDFVTARIFEPLGMRGSNVVPEPPREGQVNALGYRVDRGEEGRAKGRIGLTFGAHTELSPGSAGALFSTLDDRLTWVGLHANRGRWGDVHLVAPCTCEQMHLPATLLQSLAGEYATPIEGLSLRFHVVGDTRYVTDPGGSPEALQPYLLSNDAVGLRRKRTRYEFSREGEPTRLTIKAPGMTLEATRRTTP